MDVTDRVGEWCAVLETLAERETHEWRRNKLSEIVAFLRSHRYSAARIEALEEALRDQRCRARKGLRDAGNHHCEATVACDAIVQSIDATLSATKEPDDD